MSDPASSETIESAYRLYSDDVYRYALYTLSNQHDANDVVQEVFYRACRSWNTYLGHASPRTWLLTIARNYIYDFHRKRKQDRDMQNALMLQGSNVNIAEVSERLELESLLTQLKDRHKHVIILRHVNQLTVKETASVLGWSESKVKTTDFRALAKLRELYSSQGRESERYETQR